MVRRLAIQGLTGLLIWAVGVHHAARAATPEEKSQRILTLLAAVGEEYREAVQAGAVVRPIELQEALTFLQDAREIYGALPHAAEHPDIPKSFADVESAIGAKADPSAVVGAIGQLRQSVMQATGTADATYPPAPPSAARGAALFQDNCASCHGTSGDGKGAQAANLKPPPADFSSRNFMDAETPYDFFHVVTLGKTKTAMPAWGEALSLQERWDLVSHIWNLSHSASDTAEGQGVYLAHCASCHGASGDGHGVFEPTLVKKAAPLNLPAALARRSDTDLFHIVSNGTAGSPMPAFAGSLSDDERWKVVAFVRLLSLGGPGTTSGATSDGSDSDPRRFSGMLRMLRSAYASAWHGPTLADSSEYQESLVLSENLLRRADAVAALAQSTRAAAADQLHESTSQIRQLIIAQAPAAVVGAKADELAALVDTIPAAADAAPAATDSDKALTASSKLIEAAIEAYKRGDTGAAGIAGDAYFEFEPVEPRLGAADPDLRVRIEQQFLTLRQALRTPLQEAQATRIAADIEQSYAAVRNALRPHTSRTGLFLESAGIILREGFEIVLVITALLAYVAKSGGHAMRRSIAQGTIAGVIASVITAFLLGELMRVLPGSASMLEGVTMLLAAVMLFWVSYWLVSKAEADRWQRYIKGKVQAAVTRGSGAALAGAAFLAVYREGFETVLFYRALFISAPAGSLTVIAGIAAGTVALIILAVALRYFEVRIPLQHFFFVTGIFLYAMAAVFAGQGVHEFQESGLIGVTPIAGIPTLPLLGIFPSWETLGAQSLFVVLLLYATAITMRRRRRSNVEQPHVVDEVRALRLAVQDLHETFEGLRREPASNVPQALRERVEALLVQTEKLDIFRRVEDVANEAARRH